MSGVILSILSLTKNEGAPIMVHFGRLSAG
jgi:hypothetical protein